MTFITRGAASCVVFTVQLETNTSAALMLCLRGLASKVKVVLKISTGLKRQVVWSQAGRSAGKLGKLCE